MKKLLCSALALSFLLCGCGRAPASSAVASSVPDSAPIAVSAESSPEFSAPDVSDDFLSSSEPSFVEDNATSSLESSVDDLSHDDLLTATIPSDLAATDFANIDLDAFRSSGRFTDIVQEDDGTIIFYMTPAQYDDYAQVTRNAFVGSIANVLDGSVYSYITDVTYDDATLSVSVYVTDAATYQANSVANVVMFALYKQNVAKASRMIDPFNVMITVYDPDGVVLETYEVTPYPVP